MDALVFAGGIGEKGAAFREMVVEKVECLGFAIDKGANAEDIGERKVMQIGEGRGGKVLVCATDEQFEMARGCAVEAERFKKEQK